MDGPDRRFPSSSSSTPNKPSSVLKGTDENEQSYQEMGSNVQNLSKPPTKHFMSPTISAASKANPPRKKILAERNESQDNPLQNTQNFDSKPLKKSTILCSKSSSSSDFDEKDKNALVHDLTSNYLSPPRPKFLRYKSNRRQEILLRRENQIKEGTRLAINGEDFLENKEGINETEIDLASSSCGSLAFCSKETDLDQEIEEIDESDDEFEEVRSSGLMEVLKVLILLVVLVASTSYISSINSPNPSPVVQAVVGIKDGYHMIQDHVYEFVKAGKVFLADGNEIQMDFAEILVGFKKDERIEEDVKTEEECRVELNEMAEVTIEESKHLDNVEDELNIGGILQMESEEFTDEIAANSGLEQLENEESKVLEEIVETEIINEGGEMEKIEEISEVAISELVEELLESIEVGEMPVSSDEEERLNTEIVENGRISHVKIESEDDMVSDEAEEDTLKTGVSKDLGTESIMQAVIGLSLFCSIFASLVLGHHFRKNKNARKEEDHPVLDSCNDSVLQDKSNSAIANEEEEEFSSAIANGNEEVKQIAQPVVSFANSKSSRPKPSLKEEDSKPALGSRAPTIELLGELEVGEMSSCTLRSCGTKNRIIESEVTSHSVSMEKGNKSTKTNSVPVQDNHQQAAALSEISNINFASYSEKKKILKRQQQDEEEEMKDMGVSTPLRRSSRIRSRTIASP